MLTADSAEALSSRLGIGFAIALGTIEVFYNLGDPSWWPFILVDYIAVALLLYGAFRSCRVLAAGWGFSCAMFYMAFFISWEGGLSGPVFLGMGLLFALTILGLLLSIWAALRRGSGESAA